MEIKSINITSDRYPVVFEVFELAETEKRSLSNMANILLEEALCKRQLSEAQKFREAGGQ